MRYAAGLLVISLLIPLASCHSPVSPTFPATVISALRDATRLESHTFTIQGSEVEDVGPFQVVEFEAPFITPEALQQGAVLAYIDRGTGGQVWYQMPLVWSGSISAGNDATVSLAPAYKVGQLRIDIDVDGSPLLPSEVDGFQVRVVIVPPVLL